MELTTRYGFAIVVLDYATCCARWFADYYISQTDISCAGVGDAPADADN